jgi:hypothetical protein
VHDRAQAAEHANHPGQKRTPTFGTLQGGRLVFHVFAALADFIRELIVSGIHEGLAAARAAAASAAAPLSLHPRSSHPRSSAAPVTCYPIPVTCYPTPRPASPPSRSCLASAPH